MPKRGYRRRYGALAGLSFAGGLAKQAYRSAKRYAGKKRKGSSLARRPMKRTRGKSETRTKYKKRRTATVYAGNELNKSRRKISMGRKTVKKQLYCASKYLIQRCQGLTQFDTNSGFNRLSQTYKPGESPLWLPIHVFDLTSYDNIINGGYTRATFGNRYGWADSSSSALVQRSQLQGSAPDGNTAQPFWEDEDGSAVTEPMTKVMSEWFDIRFNLYGARKRTTTFTISMVQCPDDFSNLFSGAAGNGELKQLLQYIERPLLFNNLQTGLSDVAKKLKVIKRWSYVVAPTTTIDLNTTTGKIQEVKLFVKHNQVYNLDWKNSTAILPHVLAEDGMDFNQDLGGVRQHPINKKRTFLMVTAFCPETTPTAGGFETPAAAALIDGSAGTPIVANVEPSYDFLIRRKISVM